MSYSLHVARAAHFDLESATSYIDFVLMNPEAGDALLEEFYAKTGELLTFPEMYPLAKDPLLRSWGVRSLPVKNYLAFYTVSEERQTVYIVRFLFARRDWVSILREGMSLN